MVLRHLSDIGAHISYAACVIRITGRPRLPIPEKLLLGSRSRSLSFRRVSLKENQQTSHTRQSTSDRPLQPTTARRAAGRQNYADIKSHRQVHEAVQASLDRNDEREAIAVLEAAKSRFPDNGGWNLLIKHVCQQRRFDDAIRIFNQIPRPGSTKYTAILKGLAVKPVTNDQLGKALTIYRSLLRSDAPVPLHTFHISAVLDICCLGRNFEVQEEIFDAIPRNGPGAPDYDLYRAIFTLSRKGVRFMPNQYSPEHNHQLRRRLVRARQTWQDLQKRRISGDLDGRTAIPADVVYAYLNVLALDESPATGLEILHVVEETTGITVDPAVPIKTPLGSPCGNADQLNRNMQQPVTERSTSNLYSRPVPGMLSVLVRASNSCAAFSDSSIRDTSSYWSIFTDHLRIKPDPKSSERYAVALIREGQLKEALKVAKDTLRLYHHNLEEQIGPIRGIVMMGLIGCKMSMRSVVSMRRIGSSKHDNTRLDTEDGSMYPSLRDERVAQIMSDVDELVSFMEELPLHPFAAVVLWQIYLEVAIRSASASRIVTALKRLSSPVQSLQESLDTAFPSRSMNDYVDEAGSDFPYKVFDTLSLLRLTNAAYLLVTDSTLSVRLSGRNSKEQTDVMQQRMHKLLQWLIERGIPPGLHNDHGKMQTSEQDPHYQSGEKTWALLQDFVSQDNVRSSS
ncbi:hypothetical protein BDZ85DRAFT_257672 [Elsinoe ampelina]|uniref:Pentatricopeptide repeat protein n=1 Tax=Elsinoe ampelina TaxID=302913 RepID=A0A6A6GIU3_9PEZI|nr:hypothetical protein BDZ85DRAFT_257672 [Elsinoe ampelina]